MLTRVHHVGLVVRRLEDGLAFWRDTLGLRIAKEATVRDQGVRAALLPIGRSEIELLEPIDAQGGVARFLERRGEGLHHVCFETPDVGAELTAAREQGLPLIDQAPRPGLAGLIGFLHPKGTRGVLIEFATPPAAAHAPIASSGGPFAGLALAEVTAQSREAGTAADLLATRLGLAAEPAGAEAGCAVAAVTTGGVRLRFVSPEAGATSEQAVALRAALEAGGEGLASLVLEVRDARAAAEALTAFAPAAEREGFCLPAERCHGVPLTFRRGA